MLRTILWFLYFWLYFIVTLPLFCRAAYLEKKGRQRELDELVSKLVVNWAKRLMRLAGAKIVVTGKENIPQTAAVFVADHQGNFDIPIMLALVGRPRGLVAKAEIKKLPFIRHWMRWLHCIFLERDDPKQAVRSLEQGIEQLKNGRSLTIFPEGTRSRGGPMHAFKSGAFRIAVKAGAPVVPVTIDGSYRLMEANHMKITPGTVTVTIHPPVETAGLDKEGVRALPDKIKLIIASALETAAI